MAQRYNSVADYVSAARLVLQDMVAPYRYPDSDVVGALNIALVEMGRLRPDMFLDLKYQSPLRKGDIDDGFPPAYSLTDIVANPDGSYSSTAMVPVPAKYAHAVNWFVSGWLQFLDVTDTQDQRAQGFIQKFQMHLTTLSGA
jgi:hypothetical protein